MTAPSIDLNSDLGEGFGAWTMGEDAALLEIVTSANIACGFHAGDPSTMRRTCQEAADRNVRIGAHVGYRDLAGFGRRFIDVEPEHLRDDVLYQIAALDAFARRAGTRVRYVKPHGALYNALVSHAEQAAAVVAGVRDFDPALPVVGLPGSVFLEAAERAGTATVPEAFADRAYTAEGRLLSRRSPGAVVHDAALAARRCVSMVTEGVVDSVDGTPVTVRPASLCVHSDTAGAVTIARGVRRALEEAGVELEAFV